MASLVALASTTELLRVIVSPRVTTLLAVKHSSMSLASTPNSFDAKTKTYQQYY